MTVSTAFKVSFTLLTLIHVPFSIILVQAMRKARHIPFASKHLATGLIIFDACYISGSTLRKFVEEPVFNTQINILCFICVQLSYSSMALMALDRMYVLAWPMDYLRIASERNIKNVIYGVWSIVIFLFCIVRYIGCWVNYKTDAVYSDAGTCNKMVTVYYIALVILIQSTSLVSYIVVFKIVKKQLRQDHVKVSFKNLKTVLRMYKSTSMVLIYLVVMTITSLAYIVTITYIRTQRITSADIRMVVDIVSICNCFLDPFLYALWYTECRTECKKLVFQMPCVQRLLKTSIFDTHKPKQEAETRVFHIILRPN